MEYINGTIRVLYIKRENDYYPIGCLTNNSFSESVQTLGTTVRTNKDGWGTSVLTKQSYRISFNGLETKALLLADKITYTELVGIKRQRKLINWKIDDGTDIAKYGQGYIVGLGDAAGIDEFIGFSGEIIGHGAPGNTFDEVYFDYKDRVEADGGTLSSVGCTLLLINKWLTTVD